MGRKTGTADAVIARIAARQHGLVTVAQLFAAGITEKEIRVRVARGSLFRIHRGVYLVGHRALTLESGYLAAVLACGDGAILAGRAGGFLLGLLKGDRPAPDVLTKTNRRVPGVTTRRRRSATPLPTMKWRAIPVLTPAALIVDLACKLARSELARACHEAGVRFRTTPGQVNAVLKDRPSAPGARALRAVLLGDEKVSLSALEERFLALLTEAGLPLPMMNRDPGGKRVDCRWREYRLTVELDSYRFHNSRYAWEQDRRREREAIDRGDQFRRYTYGDVFEAGATVLRELTPLLTVVPASRP